MRSIALIAVTSIFVIGVASVARAQSQLPAPAAQAAKPAPAELSPTQTAAIQKRVETYLRDEYAWGPAIAVKVGSLEPAPAGDLYAVTVQVAVQDQSDSTVVYVSKDGRYMFRGDILNLNEDPFAAIRHQLDIDGAPSKGLANAPVVLVEFGDFECPSCRELDSLLRDVLPKYPQVRLVFKDFPLEEIHPWALTAAIAGRCAFHQSPEAFWKLHDAIYDDQDLISPENAYNKLTDLATTAGANADQFQTCMADPKTTEEVHKSEEEGKSLQINSTPTTFVDGRRLIGPDQQLLEQYIQFDLSTVSSSPPVSK